MSDELRGRVMGLYSLVLFGAMPLGSLLAGMLAQWFGAPLTVIGSALVLFSFAVVIHRSSQEVIALD